MAVLGSLGLAGALLASPSAQAQVPPALQPSSTTTTTTTQQPPPGPSGGQPSGDQLSEGSSQAPPGAQDAGGDGAAPPSGGIAVPPEAQRIIDSVKRSGPSSSQGLLDSLQPLRDLGLAEDEVLRVGMGRFPIAGAARYSHDWLFPRYGPGFRFHLGTDVFASRGTPVRAPVDGVARSANGGLGGLTVKVFMPDGTYFYLAHLEGLVEGFTDGMPVSTGDVVGYVGNSGNARGSSPHVHLGIYPNGGPPIDPKPVLDQFLVEAQSRVPELVEAYRAATARGPGLGSPPVPLPPASGELRTQPLDLLSPLARGGAGIPAHVLYATGADPSRGSRALVDLALDELAASIEWSSR